MEIPPDPRRNLEREAERWQKDFEKSLRATEEVKVDTALYSLQNKYADSDLMCPAMCAVLKGEQNGWINPYRWYDASWWYYHASPYKLNVLSEIVTKYPMLVTIASLFGHIRRADEIGEFLYSGAGTSKGTMFAFPNGDYLPSTRLIAQLWAVHKGRPLDVFDKYLELPDFYHYLVTLASEPGDPDKAEKALYETCAFHIQDFLNESGFWCFDNYFLACCPVEILYLNWIRRQKGFVELTVDHPLMTSSMAKFLAFPFDASIREPNMIRALEKLIAHNRITREEIMLFDEIQK